MLRWGLNPQKRRLGFELALSGHHFIRYARQVAETLESESCRAMQFGRSEFMFQSDRQAANLVRIEGVRSEWIRRFTLFCVFLNISRKNSARA